MQATERITARSYLLLGLRHQADPDGFDDSYVYFEKKRLLEGKKKTPTRLRNEDLHPSGFDLVEHKGMWILPVRK